MPTATSTSKPPKPAARKPRSTSRASRNGAASLVKAAATPAGTLPIGELDPKHFTNPRGDVDAKSPAFLELVASIKDLGLLEPIVVGPALVDGGKHPIVAGWRRYAAAKAAKLASVPVHQVTITEAKDALVAALAENIARDDMTPLAEARAIDTLMSEHGYTQVAAGKAVGMAERTVRERLRLLKIHTAAPEVGEAIDKGTVPMDAAVLLQQVATVAPKVAGVLAAGVEKGRWEATELTKPKSVVTIIGQVEPKADGLSADEQLVSLEEPYGGLTGTKLPLTKEQLARWKKIPPVERWHHRPPGFTFTTKDLAKLRAAGVLLEIEHETAWDGKQTKRWVLGHGSVLAQLLEDKLTRLEQAAVDRQKAQKALDETKRKNDAAAASEAAAFERNKLAVREHREAILLERVSADSLPKLASSLDAVKCLALVLLDVDVDGDMTSGIAACDPTWRGDGDVHDYEAQEAKLKQLRDGIATATTAAAAIAPVLRLALLARHMETGWFRPDETTQTYLQKLTEQLGLLDGLDDEARKRAEQPPAEPATSPLELKGTRKEKVLQVVTARPGCTDLDLNMMTKITAPHVQRVTEVLVAEKKIESRDGGWHAVEAAS